MPLATLAWHEVVGVYKHAISYFYRPLLPILTHWVKALFRMLSSDDLFGNVILESSMKKVKLTFGIKNGEKKEKLALIVKFTSQCEYATLVLD